MAAKIAVTLEASVVDGKIVVGGGLENGGSKAHLYIYMLLTKERVPQSRPLRPTLWTAEAKSAFKWEDICRALGLSIPKPEEGKYGLTVYVWNENVSESAAAEFKVEPSPK